MQILALVLAVMASPQGDVQVGPQMYPPPPCQPAALVAPGTIAPYSAEASALWTSLFDRNTGWTGADGVYATPLSGDERPCSGFQTTTLFTFGDTFIGPVNAQGQRLPGTTIVNNTQALLTGGAPSPAAISFHWDTSGPTPAAAVVPNTVPGEFFWPLDGLAAEQRLTVFALRMEPDPIFGVAIAGVSQLAWDLDAAPPFGSYTQVDTPLKSGLDTYGRAILANTLEARAPFPDGYVYVYGLREEPLNKQLLAARVLPSSLEDFAAYRFWNGSAWSSDITTAAPLLDRLSAEFSVSPLADGRVLLCYQQDDFLGPDVTVRIGTGPLGPFGPAVPVYAIPETVSDPDTFAYGAKAHPHLSQPDRLLVSYHVNTFNFAQHFQDADIYRPRFIELPLTP